MINFRELRAKCFWSIFGIQFFWDGISKKEDIISWYFFCKKLVFSKVVCKSNIRDSNPLISTFSDHWDKGRFSSSKWDKVINVDTTTLDQLINDHGHPRYIKIDVEGFELEVLKGLTKKTGIISFEFTSEFFKDAIKCLDYLNKLGYKKFNYSEGERKKFNFDWTSKDKILEEIENKIKTNNYLWGDIYAQ